jgi:hypothetical protein
MERGTMRKSLNKQQLGAGYRHGTVAKPQVFEGGSYAVTKEGCPLVSDR